MSTKRKDNKNRLLRNGESQRQDGLYAYKYYDKNGCAHFVYIWKLEPMDKVPAGKRNDLSLREKEKLIQRDAFDGIDYTGGNITILKQVEKYISIKNGNAKSTEQNYMTALALLKKNPSSISWAMQISA